MPTDQPQPSDTGTGIFGGGVGGTAAAGGGGFVSGLGLGAGIFASSGGRMAARGYAAASAQQARRIAAAADLQSRAALSLNAFEAANPGTPASVTTFNPDQKLQAILAAEQAVEQALQTARSGRQTRNLLKRERQLQLKYQKRALKEEAKTEVRVLDTQGPNAGYWFERGAPPPAWLIERGA